MKTIREFDLNNKKVLVRCDFNVPLSEKGEILNDFRIKQTLPTIEYLTRKKAKAILLSHLEDKSQKFSLKPVAKRLKALLKKEVRFLNDCIGEKIKREIEKTKAGEIVLLENLRLYKEEEENDAHFAKSLASLGDLYINDAFAVCHRAHASVVGIPKYLPFGAGFLFEKELKILTNLIKRPQKPLLAIIGGEKIETKAKLIDKISRIADFVLIGGLIKKELDEKKIKLKYPQKILEPIDSRGNGRDIGPKTINLFREKIEKAKTIFWNGPLGQTEKEKFSQGSEKIAKAIIESKAFSVAGGGETVEFINRLGLVKKFNHLSTAGGAMLAFLSGEKLPGIAALKHGR